MVKKSKICQIFHISLKFVHFHKNMHIFTKTILAATTETTTAATTESTTSIIKTKISLDLIKINDLSKFCS